MRKKITRTGVILLLILSVAGSAFGCDLNELLIYTERQISYEGDSSIESVRVAWEVYSETFYDDDGVTLLDAKIVYPQIKNRDSSYLVDKLNSYFMERKDSYLDTIATDGFHYAKGDRDASVKGEYEFVRHSYTQTIEIKYNANGLISIIYERVEDTGGVRPNVFRLADSFSLKSGRRLKLADLLGPRAERTVYGVVWGKILAAAGKPGFIYYKNYSELLDKLYDQEDFYLSESGLKVYYQPYTIAPFAAGIPEFEIPYGDVRMRMKVPESSAYDGYNEAYKAALGLVERNLVVFGEIYGLKMLDMAVPSKREKNEYLFPVIDPRFTRYDELVDFLRSTYVRSFADELLGEGRYTNVYGSLYGDIRKDTKAAYYVNWKEYGIEITKLTETSADIEITVTEEFPAGTKNIRITARMIMENGEWLLEKMIY